MTSSIGVKLIEGYQRWISPRKGFRCAYGVLHDEGTCSSIGKRIMREQGMLKFLHLMPVQFGACQTAAAVLAAETQEERQIRQQQLRARYGTLSEACNLAECDCNVRDWGPALHCQPAIRYIACIDRIKACKF